MPGVWAQMAREQIAELAGEPGEFTADHLVARVGAPPACRQLGAAFSAASRVGVIVPVGAVLTADGRLIRVWRGCVR